MLSILMITDTLRCGGAEKSFAALAKSLVKLGHKIDIIILEKQGVSNDLLNDLDHSITFLKKGAIPKWKKGWLLRYYSQSICQSIQHTKPNIVLSFQNRSNIVNVMVKNQLRKANHFHQSIHVISERIYDQRRWFSPMLHLKKYFYLKADHITCNASEIKDRLIQHFHVNKHKIDIIPNSYNKAFIQKQYNKSIPSTDKSLFTNHHKVIVNVGRLSKQKGQWHLIELLTYLPEHYHVLIIGEGELKEPLHKYAQKHGVSHRFHLIGKRDNPFAYFKHCTLFAFTSSHEGYPNALAEALICHMPTITFDFKAGVYDLVKTSNCAECIPYGDTKQMAQMILKMQHPDYKNRASQVKIHDINTLSHAYQDLFYKLCQQRN